MQTSLQGSVVLQLTNIFRWCCLFDLSSLFVHHVRNHEFIQVQNECGGSVNGITIYDHLPECIGI